MIKTHSLPLIPDLYDQTVAGLKTETRRVVVLKGGNYWCGETNRWVRVEPSEYTEVGPTDDGRCGFGVDGHLIEMLKGPYGGPGDLLHVGEALERIGGPPGSIARYARDMEPALDSVGLYVPWRWKVRTLSGRYCPKIYRRLWLTVESVHVERVQEITPSQCIREGLRRAPVDGHLDGNGYRDEFRALWDSINVERGYGWAVNPHVWVVRYSVASTTGDPRC